MLDTVVLIYTIYFALKTYTSIMQIGYINEEKRKDPVLMSASKYMIADDCVCARNEMRFLMSCQYSFCLWTIVSFGDC